MKNEVRAGFGKEEITPRTGVELCGFGPYLNRHSSRVLDPLYARAMAVEVGGARWVIVSCDLLALDASLVQRIRAIVVRETGLHPDQVMVHATHTHSGPCTVSKLIGWGDPDDLYLEMLPRFVAQACLKAMLDLKKSVFHHAEVDASGFSYNRELPDPGRTNELALDGNWKTDKPEETDTTAHVIRVDRDGKMVGFVTYFSCHPVVCCAQNREIHGDFVGVATNLVEKEHPGATGLFLQGALGDINPNFLFGPAEQSLLALERFASRFADVIRHGIRRGEPMEIASAGSKLSDEPYALAPLDEKALQIKLVENEDLIAKTGLETNNTAAMAMVYVKSIRATLARIRRGEPSDRPLSIQAFRLGPITFTGAPLELMHRIKRRFQAQLGEKALLLSVTNGFLGYAPLREYYQTPPIRYSVYMVPYMLGWTPFTENIEDEVLTAILKVTKAIL